jgi:SAM-dependent methyltransferase
MDLRETSLGFYRAWHAALGTRHGLLVALEKKSLTPSALAKGLGLNEEAVALWCEGAWAVGLLTRSGENYRLAKEHKETLGEPTNTQYLGHHFHYLAQKSLTFGALDELLHGERPRLGLVSTYAIATSYDHVASLAALPVPLRRDLTKGIDVLDLGAGQGAWTRSAMMAYPASRYTAADLELGPLRGLQDARIIDANRLPAASFDMVYLGEVLASAKSPLQVLHAAYHALRPGGRLCAIEGLRPLGTPTDWGERLVLAMGLDFATDGSRFLSRPTLRRSLREAGFPCATLRDLGGSLFQILARKPQTARRR